MCGGDDHLAWKCLVFRKRAKGCVPPEGMIASARDPLTHLIIFRVTLSL